MFFDVYEVVAGGRGGGGDASVFVTNQVQIFAAVILGKQCDGNNKSNYCLYQLYSRGSLLVSISLSRLFLARIVEHHCLGKPRR